MSVRIIGGKVLTIGGAVSSRDGTPCCCEEDPYAWKGAGWYCTIEYYSTTTPPCDTCRAATSNAHYYANETNWDAKQWGTCWYDYQFMLDLGITRNYVMFVTDGIKYTTEALCNAAGCSCP